ncbi:MAG: ThiF family adenylyltransferase [Candidatus Nanohaloarchaea archaeon]
MYSRFTAISGYGEKEQRMLEDSEVAVVGLGATGSVVADSLARHGVNLVLIDRDYLEEKDVYSSSVYGPEHCRESLPKARAAAEILSGMTDIESHVASLGNSSTGLLEGVDLVLDGTDNLRTRHIISEYCREREIPWIYTAAIAEKGYSMFFRDECFNCLIGEKMPDLGTCETEGVMREVAARTGLKSAQKAVKHLSGKDVPERLDVVHTGDRLDVESPGCRVCGEGERPHLEGDARTVSVCGEEKYQVRGEGTPETDELESAEVIARNEHLVRLEYDGREITFFSSGRAIVEARDRGHAEALYSELVGG